VDTVVKTDKDIKIEIQIKVKYNNKTIFFQKI
jgi:hypothetical protein